MIEGISHITFIVKDIEKTADFLAQVFEAQEVYSSGDKTFSLSKEKFFLIGSVWIAIMQGEPLAEKTYNHVAFKVLEKDFPEYIRRVKKFGLEIKEGRSRVDGEADSIYFYDYDNHLFEIHSGTCNKGSLNIKD
jgi:catechol 2,3-dioxygenase-like lactoylglutathione lyase family enzyme